MKASFRFLAILVLAISIVRMAHAEGECSSVCTKTENSPYCLRIAKDAGRGQAFSAIFQKINSEVDEIEKTWLLNAFEVKEDPCERSNTKRISNHWTNEGHACNIVATAKIFGSKAIGFRIEVPKKVAFQVSKSAQGTQLVAFAPLVAIMFDDPDLDTDWGGRILSATSFQDRLDIQLPNRCIQIKL